MDNNRYEKSLPNPEKIQVIDFFCGCGGIDLPQLVVPLFKLVFPSSRAV